jgi:hypothetical protein
VRHPGRPKPILSVQPGNESELRDTSLSHFSVDEIFRFSVPILRLSC